MTRALVLLFALNSLSLFAQVYRDASDELPLDWTLHPSMDVRAGDLDNDGDLDLVFAHEFHRNTVLIKRDDRFEGFWAGFIGSHDSEDIALGDFDGDGILDVIFCSQDDITLGWQNVHEYYLGDGDGTFTPAPFIFPDSEANAVVEVDINEDGYLDVIFGNNGPNTIFINNNNGTFRDESDLRWKSPSRVTQDIQIADLNGDGHPDIFVGNEDGNEIWLNDGSGSFIENSGGMANVNTYETRKAAIGDIDGDGHPDIFLCNVALRPGKVATNQFWMNDGEGNFHLDRALRIPAEDEDTLDALLTDMDGDGDLDLVLGQMSIRAPSYQKCFTNNGGGIFTEVTATYFPIGLDRPVTGLIEEDLNDDGLKDFYLCSWRYDYLLLREAPLSNNDHHHEEKTLTINGQVVTYQAINGDQAFLISTSGQVVASWKVQETWDIEIPPNGYYLLTIKRNGKRVSSQKILLL
jgi:hypothetical protein